MLGLEGRGEHFSLFILSATRSLHMFAEGDNMVVFVFFKRSPRLLHVFICYPCSSQVHLQVF